MPNTKGRTFFVWKKHSGFSLVEVVLSLFIVLALISIVLTTSGSYVSSRGSSLQGVAAKIASKKVESLRNTLYDSLPTSGSFSDSDLAKLPQGAATQTLTSYQNSPDIKLITVQISYTENGITKSIKMETLKYRNGL